jgi:iron complex outermembrane receptor protein
MKKLFFYFTTGLVLFTSLTFLKAQENEPIINANVSGKIIDSNTGEGLAGATISILNVTNSTKTNINGEFGLITGQKLPFTVIISLAGYPDKEVQITESYVTITLESNQNKLTEVTVTSRRRKETLQNVPIPVTVLSGKVVEQSGGFNVNRIKELIPSVQLYSSNPRNTTLNIRGLGSTFGLTNDGIDPGVGFYVDGVLLCSSCSCSFRFC